MTSEKARFEVLLEEMNDKIQLLFEAIVSINQNIEVMKNDMQKIQAENILIQPMYLSLQEHAKISKDHEKRIVRLERKVA